MRSRSATGVGGRRVFPSWVCPWDDPADTVGSGRGLVAEIAAARAGRAAEGDAEGD